jgi:LemA protein
MTPMTWALIGGVIIIILVLMGIYNTLIAKKNSVNMAFSTIDVQLKNRYDLIPNLVATVKQYMAHERGVLEKITELRTQALSLAQKGNMDQSIQINNEISKALRGLTVSFENYPQLRANENFMSLQASLNEIEAQIAAARRAFNAAVTEYNNALEMIPTNIIAFLMGLRHRALLETPEGEKEAVAVGKLFNN